MSTVGLYIQNYNYGCFLGDAIQSVLKQTCQPDELIVIDDCSHKFIAERDEAIAKYNVRLVKNEKNLGCPQTINRAVSLLNTDYICGLSADDYFEEIYFLEKLKQCLDDNNDVGFAYSNFIMLQPNGNILPHDRYEFDGELLMRGNYIHGSAMYRKFCFEQVGGYIENHSEDWEFWKAVVRKGWKGKKVHGVNLLYRKHNLGSRNAHTDKLDRRG